MEAATTTSPKPRLKAQYEDEIGDRLRKRFDYANSMQVPRLQKITLNMGVGEAKQDSKMLEQAQEQLAVIAGQHPNVRLARKSIASFKLREGMPVGVSVPLRDARMYEFLDRLVSVAIPRIRDFRGLNPRSFDGRGNYSIGIREQIIFPEIDYDAIDQVRGLDVTITTSAETDEEAFELLSEFGLPFQAEGRPGEKGGEDEEDPEEERRKAEARARAEAEQAALEQLKEENPEAYERPQRAEEGEEGEEGADTRPDTGGGDEGSPESADDGESGEQKSDDG
jgi:large subunit ribosomal protein L5